MPLIRSGMFMATRSVSVRLMVTRKLYAMFVGQMMGAASLAAGMIARSSCGTLKRAHALAHSRMERYLIV